MSTTQYELYFDNLLSNMLEGVAIHTLVFDENNTPVDYIILKVNHGYEKILGYKKEETEGKLASIVYGDYPAPALDIFSEVVITKIPKRLEFYYDTMKKHFSISVAPWNDIGFITIFTDITERVNTQKELEETNILLSQFIQKSIIYTFIKEVDINQSKVLYASDNFIDMVGIKGSNMIGKTMEELFEPEFAKKMTNDDYNVVNTNTILNIEEVCNNKTYSTIKFPIIIGNRKLLAGYTIDITNTKNYEDELKKSNDFNKNLLQTIPYGMDIVDKHGTILFSNKILSDKIENIIGSKCWEVHRDDRKQCLDCPLLSDIEIGKTFVIESNGIHHGKSYEISHTGIIFNGEKAILEIFKDISIQKQNEIALEKSNAVKSIFLSNISHELRTPMNAIIGFSDIILTTNKNKNINGFVKSINSNAKHLDELLNNILDYSKIESNAIDILYEDFLISDLFEELYDIFNELNYTKNLKFVKFKIDTNNIKITSDYLRLKQVLFNMLSNSIKFTDKGYITLSANLDNDFVIFKVEDTGIGIPQDKIPFVFDRFWQCDSTSRKRYKGTGLGLSIAKSIVEILNGEIWLESIINKGSTFYVKIPINKDKIEDKIEKTDIYFKVILSTPFPPCTPHIVAPASSINSIAFTLFGFTNEISETIFPSTTNKTFGSPSVERLFLLRTVVPVTVTS
jgi:PAS domain S-box-containing protein